MTMLFSPCTIKNVSLKNRLVMSPMCMSSSDETGEVKDFHLVHYATRAAGQVGLIMIEVTAVHADGRISPRDLGIWNDSHVDGLKKMVELCHEYDTKMGIQIGHAGRKANLDTPIVAPSAIPFDENYQTPQEMTVEEIKETIQDFRQSARRAKKAGFDVIEIHAAHGYLINQFLSPLTNKRLDEYGGGSKERRYQFLREIIDEVKKEWDGPLFVRISAEDYAEGGYTTDNYVEIVGWLQEQGVDAVDVSSGAVVPAHIPVHPNYQVPFSEKIKRKTGVITGAVGLITSGVQAEEILQKEQADLIFIGRELLRNPYFPRTAANELGFELLEPRQYETAPGKIQ